MNTSQFICWMIEARILNGNSIARLYTCYHLIVHHNITMARFYSHHLIGALTCCISQTYNVATHCKMYSITIIVILSNTLSRESRIRSRISTNRWTSQSHRSNALWSKCIIKAILGIKIVEHVELGIDVLHCHLSINLFATTCNGSEIILIDNDIRLNIRSLFTHSHNKNACIFWPNSSPVGTTNEIFLCGTAILIKVDCIISNKHDGRTCANSFQLFILNLYDRVIFLSVQIHHGEVIVRFDKIVICDTLNELPSTHGQNIIGIAYISQLQMSSRIDVQEQVAYIILAV